LKKILILTYYYPPCNLTAARRVESFAKYLHKFDYYPIVVTRKWEKEIKSPSDILQKTSSGIEIVTHDHFEVHYVPYQPCLRDIVFQKQSKILKLTSKFLTLFQIIGQSVSAKSIPYNNMYFYALHLIKNQKIDKLIVSANPFEIFKFGHLLHKKTKINWIADYRDDWNTSELPEYRNRNYLIKKIESYYEKKWLRNCSAVTTISNYYSSKLQNFLSKPVFTILNGFDFNSNFKQNNNFYPDFTIVYNGSLYDSQKIEIFLKGYIAF
jgi:hypothetical protein